MKKRVLIVVLALALVFALAACKSDSKGDGKSESTPDLTIGFIYIGAINDGGYTEAQHNGTVAVQDHFGDKVKCIWEESIDDTNKQDTENAAKRMIDQGATVIVGTSFGFQEGLWEMANSGDYEDITFLHFSGSYLNDKNYGNYFGAMEEPRYLAGVIAGLQTTTNKLGYVAAYDYTEVLIGIDAFTLGAKSVNPNVTVNVIYINSWYDPTKEKEAAEALLAQDCDVITQHADTIGPQLAAAKADKLTIGYNLDNSKKEGLEKAYLTAPIWHHEVYLIPTIEKIIDGTWEPESYYGTMADGYIGLAPLTANVSEDAKLKVEEIQKKIEAGDFPIFVGPIKDNAGNVVIPEGTTLDHDGIWQIEYLVEGVTATGAQS